MSPSRITRSSRWRRSTMLAVGAVAAVAMIGPTAASASWSTIDENGNTTPAGQGSAPDEAASNGDSSSGGGGGFVQTEIDSTIPLSGGSCGWTVKGHLLVRNPTVQGISDGDPVVGVKVKVSGRSTLGAALGELGYNLGHRHHELQRRVLGLGDRVRRSPGQGRGEVRERQRRPTRPGPTAPPGGSSTTRSTRSLRARSTSTASRSAASPAISHFAGQDRRPDVDSVSPGDRLPRPIGCPLLNNTTVHNPATLAPNGSWSDPILHESTSSRRTDSVYTMLHEFGHAWAYPREIGRGLPDGAVIKDGDTHDFKETPCVAFNEGFADFFGHKLGRR